MVIYVGSPAWMARRMGQIEKEDDRMSDEERALTMEELEQLDGEQLAGLAVRVTDIRVLRKILIPEPHHCSAMNLLATQRLIEIAAQTGAVVMLLGDYVKILDIVEEEEREARIKSGPPQAHPATSIDALVRPRVKPMAWHRVEAEVMYDLEGALQVMHFTVVPFFSRAG